MAHLQHSHQQGGGAGKSSQPERRAMGNFSKTPGSRARETPMAQSLGEGWVPTGSRKRDEG